MMIRRVMRTFEVRQITEDNAVELAVWLRDEGKKFDPPVHDAMQPVVSFAGEKPALVDGRDFFSGASIGVPIGGWIGWGWPTLVHEGDVATPKLLVIDGRQIEAERYDQGFEEVRLG